MGNTMRRPEPIWVENPSDELRIGVKGQPNSVIARSLRNILRYSLIEFYMVVKHSLGFGVVGLQRGLLIENGSCLESSIIEGDNPVHEFD